MNWVAWRMLTGDTTKYFGTVFGVAFGVLLIAQQMSIFVGLLKRTASAVIDIREPDVWVMDPSVLNADEIKTLPENDVYRVRSVRGVQWAVKLYKSLARARVGDGRFRQVVLIGLDDQTLIGAPSRLLHGKLGDLQRPDSFIVDGPGYEYLWPGEPVRLGRTLEMNDRRAVLVGVCQTTPPFQTFPQIYTRYSQASQFAPGERNIMSFVLVRSQPDVPPEELADRIVRETELKALTRDDFIWEVIKYYLRNTGIPINFGITILLGFIVGTAIAGQTFYLFTLENLKQFGALKAMGVTNGRLVGMILLQASVVGVLGYGIGIGMSALFFVATRNVTALSGFFLPWQVAALAALAVTVIIALASLLSLRKVLVLEPAVVFR